MALREFRRVLMPWGFALITLPDLQGVAQLMTEGDLTDPAYMSPMGPVAPLDILYGFRPALAQNLFMAHHTGFTAKTLLAALDEAGFACSTVQRVPRSLCLWAIAFVEVPSRSVLEDAQQQMLPLHMALCAAAPPAPAP